MKNLKSLFVFSPFVVVLFLSQFGFKTDQGTFMNSDLTIKQDSLFDAEAALEALREKIKGRESEPAEEVFENIQIMGKFPAGRFLNIMKMAFNNSLGVSCDHCHNPQAWDSDEKAPKQVARDMWKMVGTINGELLANIENLQSERPAVNCTVCHRGEIKPSFNIK